MVSVTVVGIEGLGQAPGKGPVSRLLDEVAPGSKILPWNGSVPSKELFEIVSQPNVLWCAHSFGATRAFRLAKAGDTILALDPRHADRKLAMTFDSLFRYQIPFQCPRGVRCMNFFQRGLFLPGHPVDGYQVSNNQLQGVSHMKVPEHPNVKAALEVILAGNFKPALSEMLSYL